MQVFQFQKSFSKRLEEYLMILSWKDHHISASQVKTEWAYFIELQIEPAGWQAIWKIPRNTCEKFKIRYPTIVFGYVDQVSFRELGCTYIITAVQDESVHLPERFEVALEDLWPTISQENPELNIESTADIIDRLRFFYSHVWMPWDNDNDDDFNWVEKHLQSRLMLCYDLREQKLNRRVDSFVRSLIAEAKYIQQTRENIEEDIFDDDSDKNDKSDLAKSRVTQLMQMHLRLTIIRSHIEMLENPDMRAIYEEVNFKASRNALEPLSDKDQEKILGASYHIVILPNNFSTQAEILKKVEGEIAENSSVFINHSLQNVLDTSKPGDKIFLSAGDHMLHFTEYFFQSGQLSGIQSNCKNKARISSTVSNSCLLMFDGDFTLENLELNCQNILAGIVVKHGTLTLKNCKLLGNGVSSVQKGIICNSHASIRLENCVLENFATGILLSNKSLLNIKETTISSCIVGVEMSECATLECVMSSFSNCNSCAIYMSGLLLDEFADNIVLLQNPKDLQKYSKAQLQMSSDCRFENCNNIICLVNEKNSFISQKTINYIESVF